jgi:hypothetical protein
MPRKEEAGEEGDEGDERRTACQTKRVTWACHLCSGSTLFFAPSQPKLGQWTTVWREAACGRTFLHVEE